MHSSTKIGNIYFFKKSKNKKKDEIDESEIQNEKFLCRFVLDGSGSKIGESIAIDEDVIIIKTNDTYLGVPLKHVDQDGKTLLVKGLVDRGKAQEMGEKWRAESFQKIKYPEEDKDGF